MPKTDDEVKAWFDGIEDEARDGEVDEMDTVCVLAWDLLEACRAARLTAPKSCADAVDIITHALAKHELLPPEPEAFVLGG